MDSTTLLKTLAKIESLILVKGHRYYTIIPAETIDKQTNTLYILHYLYYNNPIFVCLLQ